MENKQKKAAYQPKNKDHRCSKRMRNTSGSYRDNKQNSKTILSIYFKSVELKKYFILRPQSSFQKLIKKLSITLKCAYEDCKNYYFFLIEN